jgi:hypothetical protein
MLTAGRAAEVKHRRDLPDGELVKGHQLQGDPPAGLGERANDRVGGSSPAPGRPGRGSMFLPAGGRRPTG